MESVLVRLSLFLVGDTGTIPLESPSCPHPQLLRDAPSHTRRSLCCLPCWRVVSYHRLHSCLAVKECSLHSLSAQHRRPQSQKTHIPAPAKTARTQCLLQPCKSQPKMALEHYKEFMAQGNVGQLALAMVSPKDGRGHSGYRWFN